MHPVFEVLLLLCKLAVYYVEAFILVFWPAARKDIKGQNVLITGGGRGIGRQLAIKFSQQDANIILWDLNQDDLKETAEDLRIRGATVHTYICDVTKREDVIKVADDVRKEVGDVDILVNNAGIMIGKNIDELTERDIRKTYEVNTISHFWTVQAFLPSMITRRTGHIVTIASMAGKVGSPRLVDYSASKFAAYGFAEALRMELRVTAPRAPIYSTTICPMFVNTNLITGDEIKERTSFNIRFGQLMEPNFVAECIVDGVLRNKPVVYVPKNAGSVDFTNTMYPDKARLALIDFLDTRMTPANTK